jgi:hypothetical protein
MQIRRDELKLRRVERHDGDAAELEQIYPLARRMLTPRSYRHGDMPDFVTG